MLIWLALASGFAIASPAALQAQMHVDPGESPLSAPAGSSQTTTFTLRTDDLNGAQNELQITCDGAVISCSTDP